MLGVEIRAPVRVCKGTRQKRVRVQSGGILVYIMSGPSSPAFVEYVRADLGISPEGLLFVRAEISPHGLPLLIVTNEISGTVTIYQIESTDD